MAAEAQELQVAAAPGRAALLRDAAARAVDESLCSPDEFCDGFTTLGGSHRAALQEVYQYTARELRENAVVRGARGRPRRDPVSTRMIASRRVLQAEFEQIFGEQGVGESLNTLDALLARQPKLPDGTRVCAKARPPRLGFASENPSGLPTSRPDRAAKAKP